MRSASKSPQRHELRSNGRPTYSVLLTSRNEGINVRNTVDSILQNSSEAEIEIIVIDDASTDGSVAFADEGEYRNGPIRVVRNQTRRGLIYNRALAADLACGKYLAFLDAHCSVSPNWLDLMAEELAEIDQQGLVTPTVHKLDTQSWTIDNDSVGYAGCTISTPFLDFSWTPPREIDGRTCTCTIGGMAWMCTGDWYRHVGGLDRGMIIWGLENIDIPVRTWAAGGWCLVTQRVRVGHIDKEVPILRLNGVDYLYNKIRAAHNMFTADTFKKVMGILAYVGGFREAIARVHSESKTLTPFKHRFESIRRRSDDWLIDTFQLPLLEAPSYHVAPRRPTRLATDVTVPRPSVLLIMPVRHDGQAIEAQLATILKHRTYGNFDVLLAPEGSPDSAAISALESRWRDHPRVRIAPGSMAAACREPSLLRDSKFLIFLPADLVDLGPYWIEEFLLLAEKRPRLLMACPRTCWQLESNPAARGESFEAVWDWDRPGFFGERTDRPLAATPYQVLSCPELALLFVNRTLADELGGLPFWNGQLAISDLAIRGWLSGLEVICHPGVTVQQQAAPASPWTASVPPDPNTACGHVLPAEKYFTSSRRQRCRALCPQAEPLWKERAAEVAEERREFLSGARFDDDWLFFKFNIESVG